jgi:hypothetical protein
LDYRNTARPKLDEAVILAFQAACELPQATSFSAAYRLLAERWEQVFKQPVPVSQDTLRRHFASEDEKLALKEQFQQHTNRAKKDRNFTRHGRGAPDSDPPKNGPVIASSQPQHHGEEKEKSCNCPV